MINPVYNSGKNWSFYASKSAKGAKAIYSFNSNAEFGKVNTNEYISAEAPKSTFGSNAELTTATISPRAPSKGSATAESREVTTQAWDPYVGEVLPRNRNRQNADRRPEGQVRPGRNGQPHRIE